MADDSSDTRTWFLRISSGTIFGPVSTQGLVTWAEQGRAQAGNSVSTDRKNWQLAETLTELNISWYIEDDSGQIVGPFHKRAAQKIMDEGRAPDSARLVAVEDADLSRLRQPADVGNGGGASDAQPELELEADAHDPARNDKSRSEWLEERESLRLRIAELEEQMRNLLKAVEKDGKSHARQLDNARKQIAAMERDLEDIETLRADHAALQTARQDVDTLKKRIAELVGQIAEQAAETESSERLRQQRDTLESSLREARNNYAELLEYSNARDVAHRQEQEQAAAQCAALQARLEAATAAVQASTDATQQEPDNVREIHARLREQETLLAGILAEDLQTVEKVMTLEREAFTILRDGSLQRQALLQERQAAIQKLQGGETTGVFEREAKARSDKVQSAKLQETLTTLQTEHARFVRQAEARERELVSRVRLLELEEERLKERSAEAEPLFQRNQHLTELLNDREQKLAQERHQRSIEQAQLEQAHQALMTQIETRKQSDNSLPLKSAEVDQTETAAPSPARGTFRVTPWMRLKK